MTGKNRKELLEKAKDAMADKELSEALCEMITEQRGGLGFLLSMLSERPRTFNPFILKGLSIYREPAAIDTKTAELVAIAAAAALSCEHCLEVHIDRAVTEGATLDEIMDVMLITASIAESSTLSVAFRKLKQGAGKIKKAAP